MCFFLVNYNELTRYSAQFILSPWYIHKATLKFVSCPALGHNCGQSGGRKIFFFFFFYPLCIEMVEKKLVV